MHSDGEYNKNSGVEGGRSQGGEDDWRRLLKTQAQPGQRSMAEPMMGGARVRSTKDGARRVGDPDGAKEKQRLAAQSRSGKQLR